MSNNLPTTPAKSESHSTHTSTSNQYTYSFTSATPSSSDSPSSVHEFNSFTRNDDKTLLSQLHKLQRESDEKNHRYERAIRRALIENDYVKKINVRLVSKLSRLQDQRCNEDVISSLHSLDSTVQQSKLLMRELVESKLNAESKVIEAQTENAQLSSEMNETKDELHRTHVEIESLTYQNEHVQTARQELELISIQKDMMLSSLREELFTSSRGCDSMRLDFNILCDEETREKDVLIESNGVFQTEMEAVTMNKRDGLLQRFEEHENCHVDYKQLRVSSGDGQEISCVGSRDEQQDLSISKIFADAEKAYEMELEDDSLEEQADGRSECQQEFGMEHEEKLMHIMTTATHVSDGVETLHEGSQEAEMNRLTAGNADLHEQVNMLAAENADLHEQINTLQESQQDYTQIRSLIANLTSENGLLSHKLQIAASEKEASNQLLASRTKEINTLIKELNNTSDMLEQNKMQMMTVREEANGFKNQRLLMEQESDAVVRGLNSRLLDVTEEKEALNEVVLEKTNEIHLTKGELSNVSAKLEESRNELSLARDEVVKLRNEIKLAREELVRSKARASSVETQLMYVTEERNGLKECVQELDSKITQLQESLACEQSKIEEQRLEMATFKASTNDQVNALDAQLDDKCAQVTQLETENKALAQTNQQLLTEMDENSIKNEQRQLQVDQAYELVKELRKQVIIKTTVLEGELVQLKADKQQLESKIASLESDKQGAVSLITDLEEQLHETNLSAMQLTEQVHLLEVEKEEFVINKHEITTRLQSTIDNVTCVKQTLEEERQSSKNLRMKLREMKLLLDKSLIQESLKTEEINLMQKRHAEEIEMHQCEQQELEKSVQLLKKELDGYKLGISSVYEKVKIQNAELETLQKHVAAQSDEIRVLCLEKDEANTLVFDYERQLRSLSSCNSANLNNLTFDEMLMLLESEHSKRLDKLVAVQDENAILEQQVHILSKEVSRCRRENMELLKGN